MSSSGREQACDDEQIIKKIYLKFDNYTFIYFILQAI